jgi:hypothetical protein
MKIKHHKILHSHSFNFSVKCSYIICSQYLSKVQGHKTVYLDWLPSTDCEYYRGHSSCRQLAASNHYLIAYTQ